MVDDEMDKYKMCPNREKCTLKYSCKYAEPHMENHECGLGHLSCAILLNTKYTGMYHCSPCINVDAQGRVSKVTRYPVLKQRGIYKRTGNDSCGSRLAHKQHIKRGKNAKI